MMQDKLSGANSVPEPSCRRVLERKITLGGVAYQVGIFLPREGTGSLETRLLRLMEGALER